MDNFLEITKTFRKRIALDCLIHMAVKKFDSIHGKTHLSQPIYLINTLIISALVR